MIKITKEALKGYILEEVLAYLIRNTGYKLLVDPIQDPNDLALENNGLVVRGRGSVHQVDVLGQLEWIPAFTYPIRLFVEAKFRAKKTGLGIVRNAVGVLSDINQNNMPTQKNHFLNHKYQYAYALFSTSGFTEPAERMALAHQISLIDLSVDDFNLMRDAIEKTAVNIINSLQVDRDASDNNEDETDDPSRVKFIKMLRYILRTKLEILPQINIRKPTFNNNIEKKLIHSLNNIINTTLQFDELFVGMANGPFMIIMKADDPRKFIEFADQHPSHKVIIQWSKLDNEGKKWTISPAYNNREAYLLSFILPKRIAEWVFDIQEKTKERALKVKEQFFSTITIYRYIDGINKLYSLQFDLKETLRNSD